MNIEELRTQINQIDSELVPLFIRRMEVSEQVGKYKAENGLPVLDKGREREILARICDKTPDEIKTYMRVIYSLIFDLSRSRQQLLLPHNELLKSDISCALENTDRLFPSNANVACQGVEGAYSFQACDKLFPAASITACKSFDGVFNAVDKGLCEFGILPIENSTYGSVNEVYDLMCGYNFHIVRSTRLLINHALLTKNAKEPICEIFSHEQALGQCSQFLKSMPNVKITVCENTAVAAKRVAESGSGTAAIASSSCAGIYGLKVANDNIQNAGNNYTRFICISKKLRIYPGSNRISLMLTVPHTAGSLTSLLSRFSALGVNLTKLQSRPLSGSDFEFMFYFDMEASVYSSDVISLLCELSSSLEKFSFLGSYSEV